MKRNKYQRNHLPNPLLVFALEVEAQEDFNDFQKILLE